EPLSHSPLSRCCINIITPNANKSPKIRRKHCNMLFLPLYNERMNEKNNYVAIMAGGIGSRFWPESRTSYPKQFIDLLGTGRSLIQWTYHRFKTIVPEENIYFITNESYIGTLKSQIPEISDDNIISEPSRKN